MGKAEPWGSPSMSWKPRRPRIDELSGKLRGLKARREELGAEEAEDREPLSDEDVALLVSHVREVIAGGDAVKGQCPRRDSNSRPSD
jgi:hypothetical protein